MFTTLNGNVVDTEDISMSRTTINGNVVNDLENRTIARSPINSSVVDLNNNNNTTMSLITINGNRFYFDYALFSPTTPASHSDYILIQTVDSFSAENVAELEDLGAILHGYVGDNVYLVQYKPRELAPLRQKSFVVKVGLYPQDVKIDARLKAFRKPGYGTEWKPRTVCVVWHKGHGRDLGEVVEEIADRIEVSGAEILKDSNKAVLTVKLEKLEGIAATDCVRVVEEVPELVLC